MQEPCGYTRRRSHRRLLSPGAIALIDRDLLGLRYSRKNLVLNGCPEGKITVADRVSMNGDNPGQADAIVGAFRESDAPEAVAMAVKQLAERLSPGGRLLVSATSTQVARLIRGLRSQKLLRVEGERRKRGNAVLVIS